MDLDETGKAGIPLSALLSAADSGDPLDVETIETAEKTAEWGLVQLRATIDAMGSAQDGSAQAELFGRFTSDEDLMRAAAYAFRLRRGAMLGELARLRKVKGFGTDARLFERELQRLADVQEAALRRRVEQADAAGQGRLLDHFTRPLGVEGLRCPPGYTIDVHGVWREVGDEQERVATAPILIVGTAQDVHSGEVRVRIAWRRRSDWAVHTVPRGSVMDARGLLGLSNLGAPVCSGNMGAAVEYLAAFEAVNLDHLQDERTTEHMGWQDDQTFVIGPDSFGPKPVRLVAQGGLEAIGSRYAVSGTWEAWCETVEELIAPRPLAMLAIYASACTPLLRILRQPGFAVDWSGETSMGKSTSLVVAASVWGNPDDKGAGIIQGWASASTVGPMTLAHFGQSIPVFLDDTKRAKRADVVAQTLYDIPAGQERLRGAPGGGLQVCRTWRTVLLSTGEAPILSFSNDGGTRARTLCLQGAPFGENTPENRRASDMARTRLAENYGHLGRRIAAYLVAHPERFDGFRNRFAQLREEYAGEVGGVAGRAAAYVAVLRFAADLCHHLGVPRPRGCDPLGLALQAALEGTREADPHAGALRDLFVWAQANSTRFWGRHDIDRQGCPVEPHGGFAGSWGKGEQWSEIGFVPQVVIELLKRWGYDAHGVVETWHRREWTVWERSRGRVYRQARMPLRSTKRTTRMLVLQRTALQEVAGLDE